MTLIIQKPTGAKLNLAKTYVGIDDPDAAVYVAAVEAADGQSLETATKVAIHSFVKGCKADGIWPAIKASCILAGARTLTGALVPLVGTAPTNVNFVSGDYNRETGLGDASNTTKYLNTNRNNNADPQNSRHLSSYVSDQNDFIYAGRFIVTGASRIDNRGGGSGGFRYSLSSNSSTVIVVSPIPQGFLGVSRISQSSLFGRYNGTTNSSTVTSETPNPDNILMLARGNDATGAPESFAKARVAFYSIGESLDLALLDARVSALITAFAAAIP
jgi:hypothetical protein